MSDFSIATNLLAVSVNVNLQRNQQALGGSVSRLSSGLRVQSAADDPSGYALAGSLKTQVGGFNESIQNVQNANNALAVADSALASTTQILQRIRALAIEAAVDTSSQSDRANIQAEVEQLLHEVDRISQNTNFNGQALLDGSHSGFQPSQSATATITANAVLANPGQPSQLIPNGDFSQTTPGVPVNGFVVNPAIPNWTITGPGQIRVYNGTGGVPPLPGQNVLFFNDAASSNTATTTITGLQANQTYTFAFQAADNAGGGVNITANGTNVNPSNWASLGLGWQNFVTQPFQADSTGSVVLQISDSLKKFGITGITVQQGLGQTPSGVNTALLAGFVQAANANFYTTVGSVVAYNASGTYATVDGTIELQVINTGVSIAVQESFINSATGAVSVDSTLYGALQTSADFENLSVTIGSISAADVGQAAYIKVGQNVAAITTANTPALAIHSGADEGDTLSVGLTATNTETLRISNVNVAVSSTTNPSLGAEDAIGQIDLALQNLLGERAQLGALLVRLSEDVNNDSVAAVSLQASESNIRDLNVGEETTNFSKLQILVQTGTTLLSQANISASSVLGLFR